MAKDSQRGKPLLAVMIRSTKWLIAIWSVIVAYLILVAVEIALKGKAHALDFLGVVAVLLTYVLHPRVRFFEGGVEFPPAAPHPRRFLRWDQIDRHSWDGDRLILSGTTSVLGGGPVEGDAFAIPASRRRAVEQILAMKMAPP
jgi:hypothetical protein